MDTPTPPSGHRPATTRRGRGPLAGAAMAVLLMGGALGATSLASAQDTPTSTTTLVEGDAVEGDAVEIEADEGDAVEGETDGWEHDDWDNDDWEHAVEISAEDEAVVDRFDTCLEENGWSEEALDELDESEDDGTDIDQATIDAIDAAFETCDPILDDLSPELQTLADEWEDEWDDDEWDDDDSEHDFEISAEDEATLERLEDCVVDGLGGDADTVDEMMEAREYGKASAEDIAAVDAAVDGCSEILDQLGPDTRAMVDDFLD